MVIEKSKKNGLAVVTKREREREREERVALLSGFVNIRTTTRVCITYKMGIRKNVYGYLVLSFKYAIKSALSCGFFKPAKTIFVPGMYFFGFNK